MFEKSSKAKKTQNNSKASIVQYEEFIDTDNYLPYSSYQSNFSDPFSDEAHEYKSDESDRSFQNQEDADETLYKSIKKRNFLNEPLIDGYEKESDHKSTYKPKTHLSKN
jgi:hypothetical protein